MDKTTLFVKIFLLFSCFTIYSFAQPTSSSKPNIIFIMVDDLGYGDLGKFYQDFRTGDQKFDTPFLDEMADQGMMLTHHYVSAPVCAPSRASFLQGLHQGHATVRNNQFDKGLPNDNGVANLLHNHGYYTAIVGKHGLAGGRDETATAHPLLRGFDEFFGYIPHLAGHEHYPRNGTTNKRAFLFDGFTKITEKTDKVYTTDVFTARAKKIIEEQAQDGDKPFFLYLAYDTPHQKIQAPTQAYPRGKGLNQGLQWTGIDNDVTPLVNTAQGTIDSYIYPAYEDKTWPEENKKHATMIRRMGEGVKDILETLKDLNIDENTLVVFTSDNGAHSRGIDPRFFNSFGNLDGIKRDMWEGGIRVPTIAWWPGTIAASSVSDTPSGTWDWLATFAEMAGIPAPINTDGISLIPILTNQGNIDDREYLYFEYFHNSRTPDWSVFEAMRRQQRRREMQAIRIGDYKGVRYEINDANDDFEIYDVVNDPKETTNLAASMPDMQARMKSKVLQVRISDTSATRPYDNAVIPAIANRASGISNGLISNYYAGSYNYVPNFEKLTPISTEVTSNITLDQRQKEDDFGFEFSGFIQIPETGVYTFYLDAGDKSHIMIHDIHLIDNDYDFDGSERQREIHLAEGFHPIRIFYQNGNQTNYKLNLSYSSATITKTLIPDTAFRHDATVLNLDKYRNSDIGLTPNPVVNEITISLNTEVTLDRIEIFSVSGKLVKTCNPNMKTMDVSDLVSGLYFIKIKSAKQKLTPVRFIKK